MLNDAKQYDLREQIACADNLIMDIASQTKLRSNQHLAYIGKCLGYGPKQAKKYVENKTEVEIVDALKACMKRA